MNRSCTLKAEIRACRLCADRFAATATAHSPRPVVWFRSSARILIAGQAPGARVQESGRPFTDASGDRLRDWLGIDEAVFYEKDQVAVVPMGFCFPGYNDKGSDLPPPALCHRTWHQRVMAQLPNVELTVLVGAQQRKKTILLNELNEGVTKPKYIQNGVMLKAKLSKTPRTTGAKTQAREYEL